MRFERRESLCVNASRMCDGAFSGRGLPCHVEMAGHGGTGGVSERLCKGELQTNEFNALRNPDRGHDLEFNQIATL